MNNDEYLKHYASQYYDPAKAHEYYMKNRDLKGRRSSSNLNDEGKEKWSYVKNNIKAHKSNDVEVAKNDRDSQITELRERAQETRTRITEKLKKLNEILSNQKIRKNQSIDSRKEASIASLQNAKKSKGLSDAQKAKINEKIASLREDASNKKSSVTEQTKTSRSKNSADASGQRKQCASELKSAIQSVRDAYEAKKEQIDTTYEDTYQKEYDKIAAEYKKPAK